MSIPNDTRFERPAAAMIERFQTDLITWYDANGRSFPWRDTTDPFAVLLAEVMLQRTQAPQAKRIFAAFLDRHPTPQAVLAGDPGLLEEELSGLGLRHRAKRVLQLCRELVERYGGRVPEEAEELVSLPGVGPYTLHAVQCFGYGRDVPIVDRNVVRVLTRVFGYLPSAARAHTDRGMWRLAALLVPPGRARPYNLALLDLAATVCTARPHHGRCPLTVYCHHYRTQRSGAGHSGVDSV